MNKMLLLAATLGWVACGRQSDGPVIPEPITPVPSGDAGAAQPVEGATAYENVKDPRFSTLPVALNWKILACEAGQHVFDLGLQICTDLTPAPFPCVIDDA